MFMRNKRYIIISKFVKEISKEYNVNLYFIGLIKQYYTFSMVIGEELFIYKILCDLPLFLTRMILLEYIRKDIRNARQ